MNETSLYNFNYFACITSNIYFKFLVVLVLGLVITFIDKIDVLHDKRTFLGLLLIVLLFSWTHLEELGATILLLVLLMLVFNIQLKKQKGSHHNEI